MNIFSEIAEKKIKEAFKNGEFDNLRNKGTPIIFDFDNETWVPEDLKIAYRILKNSGCIPPELELRNEVLTLRDLINTIDDNKERIKKIRELNFKVLKLNELRTKQNILDKFPEYEKKIF